MTKSQQQLHQFDKRRNEQNAKLRGILNNHDIEEIEHKDQALGSGP